MRLFTSARVSSLAFLPGAELTSSHAVLTRYYPFKKPRTVKNLLAGPKMTPEEEEAERIISEAEAKEIQPIISYYHQNMSLQLVVNSGVVAASQLPPPLQAREFGAAERGSRS